VSPAAPAGELGRSTKRGRALSRSAHDMKGPIVSSHILQRTGNASLKFDGELIAESKPETGSGKKARDSKRWHEFAIYRTTAGKLVLAITYRAEWQGEHSHYSAEVFPDVPSVVAAIRKYDPISHVRGYPPGEAYAEKQQRLLAEIRERYNAQVGELLNREEFAEVIE
jgi:hypothetical protein